MDAGYRNLYHAVFIDALALLHYLYDHQKGNAEHKMDFGFLYLADRYRRDCLLLRSQYLPALRLCGIKHQTDDELFRGQSSVQ